MSEARSAGRAPLAWIPSLYLAEGLPNILVSAVSVVMYKRMGVSNTDIALYTSLLYLPWVLKPLWSPLVDLISTRRRWIWATQLVLAAGLAGVAFTIPLPGFFAWTLACFWVLSFTSATHDIAADGFYMLASDERQQSLFIGVRNLFYRIAVLTGQGLLVWFAGRMEGQLGVPKAWSLTFGLMAATFVLFALWHRFVLPRAAADRPGEARRIPEFLREFFRTFGSFFRKPGIVVSVLFILVYRLGEAQLVKMVAPFLLDPRAKGGLELSTETFGLVYGTFGIAALALGGIVGGWAASRRGLKAWLWPMLFAIHLPDAVFLYLAYAQPHNLAIIQACVVVEQFGYGFGFTAMLLYMMYLSRGEHQTAHYAICTGFMALGLMLPGMWSGALEDLIGYRHFFLVVILATIPSFIVTRWIQVEEGFGKRTSG